MPIKTLEIRSTTRIRVFWSSATGTPSAPGSYTLLSLDGRGAPPTAVAVLVVAADSTQRELVLSWELVGGASYSLSGGGSTTRFVTPEPRPAIAAGLTCNSFDREFFKVDLFFDGTDYVEQIDGDLAELAGEPNGRAAFQRGMLCEGLPWAPDWGGKLREFVGAPDPVLIQMSGNIMAQARRDDRIGRVTLAADATRLPSGEVTIFSDVAWASGATPEGPPPRAPGGPLRLPRGSRRPGVQGALGARTRPRPEDLPFGGPGCRPRPTRAEPPRGNAERRPARHRYRLHDPRRDGRPHDLALDPDPGVAGRPRPDHRPGLFCLHGAARGDLDSAAHRAGDLGTVRRPLGGVGAVQEARAPGPARGELDRHQAGVPGRAGLREGRGLSRPGRRYGAGSARRVRVRNREGLQRRRGFPGRSVPFRLHGRGHRHQQRRGRRCRRRTPGCFASGVPTRPGARLHGGGQRPGPTDDSPASGARGERGALAADGQPEGYRDRGRHRHHRLLPEPGKPVRLEIRGYRGGCPKGTQRRTPHCRLRNRRTRPSHALYPARRGVGSLRVEGRRQNHRRSVTHDR